jgi:hypothetical protein
MRKEDIRRIAGNARETLREKTPENLRPERDHPYERRDTYFKFSKRPKF